MSFKDIEEPKVRKKFDNNNKKDDPTSEDKKKTKTDSSGDKNIPPNNNDSDKKKKLLSALGVGGVAVGVAAVGTIAYNAILEDAEEEPVEDDKVQYEEEFDEDEDLDDDDKDDDDDDEDDDDDDEDDKDDEDDDDDDEDDKDDEDLFDDEDDLVAVKDDEGNFVFVDKEDPVVNKGGSGGKKRKDFAHLDNVIKSEAKEIAKRDKKKVTYVRDRDGDLVFRDRGKTNVITLTRPKPSIPTPTPSVTKPKDDEETKDTDIAVKPETTQPVTPPVVEKPPVQPSKPVTPPTIVEKPPVQPGKPVTPPIIVEKPPVQPGKPVTPPIIVEKPPVQPGTPVTPPVVEKPPVQPGTPVTPPVGGGGGEVTPPNVDGGESGSVEEKPNNPFDNPVRSKSEIVHATEQMAEAQKLLNLVNEYRAKYNLSPVKMSSELMYATHKKAEYSSHHDGSPLYVDSQGDLWSNHKLSDHLGINPDGSIREVYGKGSVESMFSRWLLNGQMTAYLLSPDVTELGFSTVDNYGVAWLVKDTNTYHSESNLLDDYLRLTNGLEQLLKQTDTYTEGSIQRAKEIQSSAISKWKGGTKENLEEAISYLHQATNSLINKEVGSKYQNDDNEIHSISYKNLEKKVKTLQKQKEEGAIFNKYSYESVMAEWEYLQKLNTNFSTTNEEFRKQLILLDEAIGTAKVDTIATQTSKKYLTKRDEIQGNISRIGEQNFHQPSLARLLDRINNYNKEYEENFNTDNFKGYIQQLDNSWNYVNARQITEYNVVLRDMQALKDEGVVFTEESEEQYNKALEQIENKLAEDDLNVFEYREALAELQNAYKGLVTQEEYAEKLKEELLLKENEEKVTELIADINDEKYVDAENYLDELNDINLNKMSAKELEELSSRLSEIEQTLEDNHIERHTLEFNPITPDTEHVDGTEDMNEDTTEGMTSDTTEDTTEDTTINDETTEEVEKMRAIGATALVLPDIETFDEENSLNKTKEDVDKLRTIGATALVLPDVIKDDNINEENLNDATHSNAEDITEDNKPVVNPNTTNNAAVDVNKTKDITKDNKTVQETVQETPSNNQKLKTQTVEEVKVNKEIEPQSEVQAQPQPKVQAQPQPKVQAQPQPKVQAQPQPKAQAQPEAQTE